VTRGGKRPRRPERSPGTFQNKHLRGGGEGVGIRWTSSRGKVIRKKRWTVETSGLGPGKEGYKLWKPVSQGGKERIQTGRKNKLTVPKTNSST